MPIPEATSCSVIQGITYDAGTRSLRLTFKGGRHYSYVDVAPELYEELRDARVHPALEPSHG
ncbi:KTSC domain-containing protein [Altererythrobacter sp. TH136]|nr:KTSC domain-containing protein [Altererythrobacter sp. TH136]